MVMVFNCLLIHKKFTLWWKKENTWSCLLRGCLRMTEDKLFLSLELVLYVFFMHTTSPVRETSLSDRCETTPFSLSNNTLQLSWHAHALTMRITEVSRSGRVCPPLLLTQTLPDRRMLFHTGSLSVQLNPCSHFFCTDLTMRRRPLGSALLAGDVRNCVTVVIILLLDISKENTQMWFNLKTNIFQISPESNVRDQTFCGHLAGGSEPQWAWTLPLMCSSCHTG